jgi:hypothetical protein
MELVSRVCGGVGCSTGVGEGCRPKGSRLMNPNHPVCAACFASASSRPVHDQSAQDGGGCSRSRRYLECALRLRCPRPGLGHRKRLRAGRGARRTPSGSAASSIGDDVAADVGGGAAVASIAPAHIARVGCCCMTAVESLGARC